MASQVVKILAHDGKEVIGNFNMARPAPPSSMEDFADELAIALGVEDETNRFEQLFAGPREGFKQGRNMVSILV